MPLVLLMAPGKPAREYRELGDPGPALGPEGAFEAALAIKRAR